MLEMGTNTKKLYLSKDHEIRRPLVDFLERRRWGPLTLEKILKMVSTPDTQRVINALTDLEKSGAMEIYEATVGEPPNTHKATRYLPKYFFSACTDMQALFAKQMSTSTNYSRV